jgi:hypothetical protein
LYEQLPAGVLKFDWLVNIKPVGNGQAVLKYYIASQMTSPVIPQRKPPKCDRCGGELELLSLTDSRGKWIWCRGLSTRGPPKAPQAVPRRKAPMA